MPKNYSELVEQKLLEEYHYQVAKTTKALLQENSKALDALYRLVARELAQTDPPLIIPYTEITVSAQCTLNCTDCSNLMNYYKNPPAMSLEDCKTWVSKFVEAVDHVMLFRVMGGEALMQKNLLSFLEFLAKQDKLEHIQIVTNATLALNDEYIRFLANNKRFSLAISHYPKEIVKNYDNLVAQCVKYNIQGITSKEEMEWLDFGSLQKRGRTKEENEQVYKECTQDCRHIWQGELHVCPRSAHAMALRHIKRDTACYVDLINTDRETRRNQIKALYELKSINACDYCNSMQERKSIAAARQK